VLTQLLTLAIALVVQGNSSDAAGAAAAGRAASVHTLTDLGPCFIKVGQALSTRPDLVRRDWLEQLTRLQDDLPPFDHAIALATIEADWELRRHELLAELSRLSRGGRQPGAGLQGPAGRWPLGGGRGAAPQPGLGAASATWC
jgi:predicted unusual protein kinase regulating ubiquinone biosynthesis (AarF/ABC1/UbiB family)